MFQAFEFMKMSFERKTLMSNDQVSVERFHSSVYLRKQVIKIVMCFTDVKNFANDLSDVKLIWTTKDV